MCVDCCDGREPLEPDLQALLRVAGNRAQAAGHPVLAIALARLAMVDREDMTVKVRAIDPPAPKFFGPPPIWDVDPTPTRCLATITFTYPIGKG